MVPPRSATPQGRIIVAPIGATAALMLIIVHVLLAWITVIMSRNPRILWAKSEKIAVVELNSHCQMVLLVNVIPNLPTFVAPSGAIAGAMMNIVIVQPVLTTNCHLSTRNNIKGRPYFEF